MLGAPCISTGRTDAAPRHSPGFALAVVVVPVRMSVLRRHGAPARCLPGRSRDPAQFRHFPLDEAIDIQVSAVRRLGLRATLTRGSMTLGQDDGGLPPQSVVQPLDAILEDSARLVRAYHERGAAPRFRSPSPRARRSPSRPTPCANLPGWQRISTSGCTPTSSRRWTRRTSAASGSACARSTTSSPSAGSPTAPGSGTASTSTTTRSAGSARRGRPSRTAPRRTCASPRASPASSSWRTPASPWGSASTGPPPTTPLVAEHSAAARALVSG